MELNALFLNCTLKKSPEESNTEGLINMVRSHFDELGVESEVIRPVDYNIPFGVVSDMGGNDEWPQILDKIKAADALLFATPEYNYSMSGVLKNAIDWASRPPDQPFNDKPVAVMGASPSALGTGRAQYHLRQSCVFLNMHLLNKPEVMIAAAQTKFNEQGQLTDEPTRGFIRELLVNVAAWTRRLRQS